MRENECVEVQWIRACGSNACVEVGFPDSGSVMVRDSKDAQGPILVFTSDEWAAFTEGVRAGEFDF